MVGGVIFSILFCFPGAQIKPLPWRMKHHLQRVAHRALASRVRTGGLPSVLQQMALPTDPVHRTSQDREVLTVGVGGMKMGMPTVPIQAADAHQIGCHLHHRNTKHVGWHMWESYFSWHALTPFWYWWENKLEWRIESCPEIAWMVCIQRTSVVYRNM